MTLVVTMSPPMTPSVDCVFNRIGRTCRNMQHYCEGTDSFRHHTLCQYQVPRTPRHGPCDGQLAHFTGCDFLL